MSSKSSKSKQKNKSKNLISSAASPASRTRSIVSPISNSNSKSTTTTTTSVKKSSILGQLNNNRKLSNLNLKRSVSNSNNNHDIITKNKINNNNNGNGNNGGEFETDDDGFIFKRGSQLSQLSQKSIFDSSDDDNDHHHDDRSSNNQRTIDNDVIPIDSKLTSKKRTRNVAEVIDLNTSMNEVEEDVKPIRKSTKPSSTTTTTKKTDSISVTTKKQKQKPSTSTSTAKISKPSTSSSTSTSATKKSKPSTSTSTTATKKSNKPSTQVRSTLLDELEDPDIDTTVEADDINAKVFSMGSPIKTTTKKTVKSQPKEKLPLKSKSKSKSKSKAEPSVESIIEPQSKKRKVIPDQKSIKKSSNKKENTTKRNTSQNKKDTTSSIIKPKESKSKLSHLKEQLKSKPKSMDENEFFSKYNIKQITTKMPLNFTPSKNATPNNSNTSILRRSSLSNRGRRLSSVGNGFIAEPHNDIPLDELYKHFDSSLPDPHKMKQLLVWCSKRLIQDNDHINSSPSTGRRRSQRGDRAVAESIANIIKEEFVRDLVDGKINTSWYITDENNKDNHTNSTSINEIDQPIIVKPNPTNIANLKTLHQYEKKLDELTREENQWLESSKIRKFDKISKDKIEIVSNDLYNIVDDRIDKILKALDEIELLKAKLDKKNLIRIIENLKLTVHKIKQSKNSITGLVESKIEAISTKLKQLTDLDNDGNKINSIDLLRGFNQLENKRKKI
ncbi:hypothetical protein CANARDRAFT_22263 [[Candida] arabinofermentans NRRL YB-2248]|uniref:Kinetochore protein mis13 n=1 Tax=[Candida] arabinofermentans NRRL YB-2248 TaxID=983967 RepID=A0A1E4T3N9_9ASCO|nr:hypothetical protein CANARDRAFT_22263 [[Candida] arabinofermentans NRRL YB-2248]